jgi:hypothetical protein
MDAYVTVEFTIRDVCSELESEVSDDRFEEMVRARIKQEGLLSLCVSGSVTIVAIERV